MARVITNQPLPSAASMRARREAGLSVELRAEVVSATTPLFERQTDVLRRSASQSLSGRKRLRVAIELVDEFGAAIAPMVACRSGCAHCCHIPVEMTELEAIELGAAIGRVPCRDGHYAPHDTAAFGYDTPCPFLEGDGRAGGSCSIYAQRPFACRKHHSLDVDALFCRLDVPSEFADAVPSIRPNVVLAAYGATLRSGMRIADIRDWFPGGADLARGCRGGARLTTDHLAQQAGLPVTV